MSISLLTIQYDYFFRTYNVHAMSFTPEEIFVEVGCWRRLKTNCTFQFQCGTNSILKCIRNIFQVSKKVPDLKIEYEVDSRQQIADSWPMVDSPLHCPISINKIVVISDFQYFSLRIRSTFQGVRRLTGKKGLGLAT